MSRYDQVYCGVSCISLIGDSGGPLICVDNNRPVLYGVTSWGIGCGDKGYPGVFAKVSAVLNWISSTANI